MQTVTVCLMNTHFIDCILTLMMDGDRVVAFLFRIFLASTYASFTSCLLGSTMLTKMASRSGMLTVSASDKTDETASISRVFTFSVCCGLMGERQFTIHRQSPIVGILSSHNYMRSAKGNW